MKSIFTSSEWPVLKIYDKEHIGKIALPLGGIGTGTVSFCGNGSLKHWELCNMPGKNFVPRLGEFNHGTSFFAIRTQGEKSGILSRGLEGPMELYEYEGARGSTALNHGLARFRNCEFHAAYPFGQVLLSDPEMPVKVRIKAFNPLIPGDVERSSFPAAVICFEVENLSMERLDVSVCGTVPNFIGEENSPDPLPHSKDGFTGAKGNQNRLFSGKVLQGVVMEAPELPEKCRHKGDMFLGVPTAEKNSSFRTSWKWGAWNQSGLDFWDDFNEDGLLEERKCSGDKPSASVAVKRVVESGKSAEFVYILAWRFPNRKSWNKRVGKDGEFLDDESCQSRFDVGNWYAERFSNSTEAAEELYSCLKELEADTISFVNAFCESDIPEVVKEAALFNLSTLCTETCFRTADGKFYGWEGCGDTFGSCHGNCTHVWNYEHSLPFLFSEIARDHRKTEFLYMTGDAGNMSFRVGLPLNVNARIWSTVAADGQMGCIMKIYREWQISGDDSFLKKLWPDVRKAMEFCWVKGGWDADRDGIMEGCQHNTMDVEYYGPNPQMGFWYLGALKCTYLMAEYLQEHDFASECRRLYENGRKMIDDELFNGEYYEHCIMAPGKNAYITPELLLRGKYPENLENPDFQLGAGCLIDQLVGQLTAHVLDLGDLSDSEKHRKTLKNIVKYNSRNNFYGHCNTMRSFVLGDELALLMASFPHGNRPEVPFPYFTEVMTGFEYVVAVHMLYEGMTEEGLKIISNIRSRYDGRKRSPFDEAECGHHYARAMAAYGAVTAFTGFHYSGVEKTMKMKNQNGTYFWASGNAWGTCAINDGKVKLNVLSGNLELKSFELTGRGNVSFKTPVNIGKNETKAFSCS